LDLTLSSLVSSLGGRLLFVYTFVDEQPIPEL
jgi:hypothetical protein